MLLCSYRGIIDESLDEVEVLGVGNASRSHLFAPRLKQLVSELLVEGTRVGEEAGAEQHIAHESEHNNHQTSLARYFIKIQIRNAALNYLSICALNSLLCSVQRTRSPANPPMSVEAAVILRRHESASSISICFSAMAAL